MFKVADRNSVAKKPSARLSDNVKDIEENVINTNAKAVKWNEDNKMKIDGLSLERAKALTRSILYMPSGHWTHWADGPLSP